MANGRRPRPVEHPLMGRRVRLSHTNDPHTELVAGDEGTVSFIDSVGTVHVRWDRGSSLGLIADAGDRWEVIDEDG